MSPFLAVPIGLALLFFPAFWAIPVFALFFVVLVSFLRGMRDMLR